MSGEQPDADVQSAITVALNAILIDDLAYIDGLQWRADIESAALRLDHRLNSALSAAGLSGFCVSVKLNPARVTVQ